MTEVNSFYLGAFITYLVVVLGIGVWAYRRTKDVMDFWVMGQNMGPDLRRPRDGARGKTRPEHVHGRPALGQVSLHLAHQVHHV